jgi:hypothetical protein
MSDVSCVIFYAGKMTMTCNQNMTMTTKMEPTLFNIQLLHCSLSCESRMRSDLTAPPLILSHFFAASNLSIIGPLYSTLRIPHSSS